MEKHTVEVMMGLIHSLDNECFFNKLCLGKILYIEIFPCLNLKKSLMLLR